ncbi:hypothetical protein ACKI1J_33720 [Streptomyces scabiei]|uniref:hypothetical protein n=1 Tax=Streptomyces scabiei TaxID=1930 RepID=UPI0038F63DDF
MVRRSQSSNPRAVVVLTGGADWPGRAAREQRSSSTKFQLPEGETEKIKALRRTIKALRKAVNAKHGTAARYLLRRARALVNALPAHKAKQEREQLTVLREKFYAQGKPVTSSANKSKAAARSHGKKPAPKTSTAKKAVQKPKPTPVRDLGDRFINRAALGYGPTDKPKGS